MTDGVVVDTDVVSFLFKVDTRADLYRPHLDGGVVLVSFMTVAELDRWALERNWGPRKRQNLETFLHRFAVTESSRAYCGKWAEVTSNARRIGRPIETADAWIAAAALLYDIPLVTHNRSHFAGVDGLTVISEAR